LRKHVENHFDRISHLFNGKPVDVTSVARELHWTGADATPSTPRVEEAGRWFADALVTRLAAAEQESAQQREASAAATTAAVV
jgi:hypothetical protein